MATSSEYAILSNAAYAQAVPVGWRLVGLGHDPSTGFLGIAYQRESEAGAGEIVVAYAGTDILSRDLWADAQLALDRVPSQYLPAKRFLDAVQRDFPNATISLTGHSLGGGLAELVAAAAAQDGVELHVTSFNAPGTAHLLDEESIAVDLGAAFAPDPQRTIGEVLAGNIQHYVVVTDPFGNFRTTFGTEVPIDPPWPSALSLTLSELAVAFSYTGVIVAAGAVLFYEQHRMANFLHHFGVEDYAVSAYGTMLQINGHDVVAAVGSTSVTIETELSPFDVLSLPGGASGIWWTPGVPKTAEVIQVTFTDAQGKVVETAWFRRYEDGVPSLTTIRTCDTRTVEIISQFDGEADFLYVSDLGGGLWTIHRMAGDGRGTVTTTAAPDGADAVACTDPRLLWAGGWLTATSGIDVRFVDARGDAVQTHEMVRLADGAVVHRIDLDPASLGGADRMIEYDPSGAVVLDTVFREDGTEATRTYQSYGVRGGDTLSEIAERYGLGLAELLAIPDNLPFRADPDRLRAGADVVSVPAEVREYDARGELLLLEVFAHAAPEEFFGSWSDDFAHDSRIRFYDGGVPGRAYEIARDPDGGDVDTTVTVWEPRGTEPWGDGDVVSVTRVRGTTDVTLETGATAGEEWLDPWTARYLEQHGISRFSVTSTVWDETVTAFYPVSAEIEDLFFRGEQRTMASPIVLDLDGNGYDTTTLVNGVRFDFDLNGFAEQMAWVRGGDGLLVLDRDGSGAIEHGGELFGDHTLLLDGSPADHGFEALAELDGNADGRVDAADEFFRHLRVWRDLDHDGISEGGELLTLEAAGVEALLTESTTVREQDGRGNVIIEKGWFVRPDGSPGPMADFLFDRDVVRSVATEKLPVPEEIALLPNVAGSGNVFDLHQALVRDGSGGLREIVDRFAGEADPERRRSIVHELLWAWSGTAGVRPDSRGPYVDARHLETLEAFLGTSFRSAQNPNGKWAEFIANPHPGAAPYVEAAYGQLADGVYAVLSAQTHQKHLFGLVTEYRRDEASGRLYADLGPAVDELLRRLDADPVAGREDLAEFSAVLQGLCSRGFAADYARFRSAFALRGEEWAWVVDSAGKHLWAAGAGGMLGDGPDDAFPGGPAGDAVRGGRGDDSLYGGGGDDRLEGGEGADVLAGGPGADLLEGGPGADLYAFGRGDGSDVVHDTGGAAGEIDRLAFGPGIAPTDVAPSRDLGHLYLELPGTGDRLTLLGWFWDERSRLERFEFADGTVWGPGEVQALLPSEPTEGDDFLFGSEGADTLAGWGGRDRLWGAAGDDVLRGGPGDDELQGGLGSDVLEGDAGCDLLAGDAGDDVLRGGEGADVLRGADGADVLEGGDGDDLLHGGDGPDVLHGGPGDDRLAGDESAGWWSATESGSDVYRFGRGDGRDTVVDVDPSGSSEGAVADRVELGEGIAPSDVAVSRDAWSLHLTLAGTGDRLTLSRWFEHERFQVEEVVFADGTLWGASRLQTAPQAAPGDEADVLGGTPWSDRLEGAAGDDELYGHAGCDELLGGPGDDALDGGEGDDVLAGGSGADRLAGGDGGDVYLFGSGDGLDRVEEGAGVPGDVDVLRLGPGVAPGNVEAVREGDALRLVLGGGADQVVVEGYFRPGGPGVERIEFEDGTAWSAGDLPRLRCDGTELGDVLRGGDGDEHLRGLGGDDLLRGGGGCDRLDGGPGNDLLDGGAGTDRYVFGEGGGRDVLEGWGGDAVELLPGIDPAGVSVRATYGLREYLWSWSLEIAVGSGGDRLTLTDWDPEQGISVEFADGTVWDGSRLAAISVGAASEAADALRGTAGAEILEGLGGDDVLDAGAGDDVLSGGPGTDTLRGGPGGDTYRFGRGDGYDRILEDDAGPDGPDTIRLGAGVRPKDLAVSWVHGGSPGQGDLVLTIADTGERLCVVGWFTATAHQVEKVEFADGTVWDAGAIAALARAEPTGGPDHLGGTPGAEVLEGGGGDDTLRGYGGSDTLRGGEGADALYGGDGGDVLDGGPGNDLLCGDLASETWDHGSYVRNPESGSDTYLFGRGYGEDTIRERDHASLGNPALFGYSAPFEPGVDTVRLGADLGPGDVSVHLGGSGDLSHLGIRDTDDRLFGLLHVERVEFADGTVWTRSDLVERATLSATASGGADVLFGTDGPDRMDGLAGDDTLRGGEGDDVLYGGPGADRLEGWNGADSLFGGDGDDALSGGRGADLLRGGAGRDVLHGDDWGGLPASDALFGDEGDDVLYGRGGNDILVGGPGDDLLVGDDTVVGPFGAYERGADTYRFGPGHGADTIRDADATRGEQDVLELGPGIAPSAVLVTRGLHDLHLSFSGASDRVTVQGWFLQDGVDRRIEVLEFADGTVWSAADVEARLPSGPTAGDDVLAGGPEPDRLLGLAGNDTLLGGGGGDALEGGEGRDRLEGHEGNDALAGGAGDDTLLGGDGDDALDGGDGNDSLEGGAGADVLVGGGGADLLLGGAGPDILSGGPGNDSLDGGPGADLFRFGWGDGQDTLRPGGDEPDAVRLGAGVAPADVRLTWAGGADLHLVLAASGDRLTLGGWLGGAGGAGTVEFEDGTVWDGEGLRSLLSQTTEGADFLLGSGGDDTLDGGGGDDVLDGAAGGDLLFGGPGRDDLRGGPGRDVLDGGPGDDLLAGGAGDDTYRFGPGGGVDRVYDGAFEDGVEGPGGLDTVAMASGVQPDDVRVGRDGGDLTLTLVASGEGLTLMRWFEGEALRVERVEFADGTAWDAAALGERAARPTSAADFLVGGTGDDRIQGLEGNDRIFGGEGGDELDGGPGRDELRGGAGDDRLWGGEGDDDLRGDSGRDFLDGGTGDDLLQGQAGGDVYGFGRGYGRDRVWDEDFTRDASDVDSVRFGDDVLPAQVSVTRDEGSLYLEIVETGDRLALLDWFADVRMRVERVEFSDGTVWCVAELQDLVLPRPTEGDDVLYGTPFRDFVEAGGGSDTVRGLGGDDELFGGGGKDLLLGGDGDDSLAGGDGDDRLDGGPGRDVLDGGGGNDELAGGAGSDTYRFGRGSGADCVREGLSGPGDEDRIALAPGVLPSDVAATRKGADLVLAIPDTGDGLSVCGWFDGPAWQIESVCFSDGTVWDRAEVESLSSGATPGEDVLSGTAGADLLRGGGGDDRLRGGAGNDVLHGDGGRDWLYGEAGDDELHGGEGEDYLSGGEGNDVLRGEGGGAGMDGGPGADLLDPGTGRVSGLNGGPGDDTYLFGRGAGEVFVQEDDPTAGNCDTIRLAPDLSPADVALGRDDSDLLLRLPDTGDLLNVSGWFMKTSYQVERVCFADGTVWEVPDLLRLAVQSPSDAGETLGGTPYADVVEGLGGDDTLLGWSGDDRLVGGAGDDRLFGVEGDDLLQGGEGRDTMNGGTGNDRLDGGPGDDFLQGDDGSDTYCFGLESGHDTMYQARRLGVDVDTVEVDPRVAPSDVQVRRDVDDLVLTLPGGGASLRFERWFWSDDCQVDRIAFADGTVWDPAAVAAMMPPEATAGSDRLVGGAGADVLDGLGGHDLLYGREGDDVLLGGAGADRLWGEDGDDLLLGGEDDDQLDGGPGADVLDGGPVGDRLRGGPGDDVYVFARGSHWDIAGEAGGGGEDAVRVLGYGPEDLAVVRGGDWLTLRVRGSAGEAMALEDWFRDEALRIERVEFPDGTVWDEAELERRARLPTEFADEIVGTEEGEFLDGGPSYDLLFGLGGADVLEGGPGDDYLYGGAGADAYLFGPLAGRDRVYEDDPAPGSVDVVRLAAGVGPDAVKLGWDHGDLEVRILGTESRLTLERWFEGERYRVEAIEFADGTVWDAAAMQVLALTPTESADVLPGGSGDDRLRGLGGDDQLFGFEGDDVLEGEAGNDWLYGDLGRDVLSGGEGSDTLNAGDGADSLEGGPGDDRLEGGRGGDRYLLGGDSGSDTVCEGSGEWFDRDVLVLEDWSAPAAVAVRRGDALHLADAASVDSVEVEWWYATERYRVEEVRFGDGTVWGPAELEALAAGSLCGSYYGGRYDDLLRGTAGGEALFGFDGSDELHGEAGDDVLLGGRGGDILWGESGDDVLSGGAGDDVLRGGAGGDTYRFGAGFGWDAVEEPDGAPDGADSVVFGPGVRPEAVTVGRDGASIRLGLSDPPDRLTVRGWFAAEGARVERFAFADGTVWTWQQVQEAACRVIGTEGDDVLAAYAEGSTLLGLGGNDRLAGGAGADTLQGGGGDDTLDGGPGDDRVEGGVGDDVYRFAAGWGEDRVLDEGGGDAVVFAEGVRPEGVAVSWGDDDALVLCLSGEDRLVMENFFADPRFSVERIEFADGSVWSPETLPAMVIAGSDQAADRLRGFARGEVLLGLGGDDLLEGLGGDDRLEGGAGGDRLQGGDGDDTLDGGPGDDRLEGGGGDDTYVFGPDGGADLAADTGGADAVVLATGVVPKDVIVSRGASDLHLTLAGSGARLTLAGWFGGEAGRIETVVFSGGETWDAADLRELSRYVSGGEGPDTLLGYEDGDVLLGGGGDDALTGGAGDDVLDGGEGDDLLDGGEGADRLDGGAGDDLLDAGPGPDRLAGGEGSDRYVFGRGSGRDTVVEEASVPGAVDRVVVAPDLSTADVRVTRTLTDLMLCLAGSEDCLTVADWFVAEGSRIELVEFGDGTAWDVPSLVALSFTPTGEGDFLVGGAGDESLQGLGGDDVLLAFGGKDRLEGGPGGDHLEGGSDKDTLIGGEGHDRLLGGEGKDTLLGGPGDDHLDGGPGDDDLAGGGGSDTYRFVPGGGRDRLQEAEQEPGERDTLEFAAAPLDLVFEARGSGLDVLLAGTGDSVAVDSWYRGAQFRIEEFRARDGRVLAGSQVEGLIQAMAAFSSGTGLDWSEAVALRPAEVEAILAQHWSPAPS